MCNKNTEPYGSLDPSPSREDLVLLIYSIVLNLQIRHMYELGGLTDLGFWFEWFK